MFYLWFIPLAVFLVVLLFVMFRRTAGRSDIGRQKDGRTLYDKS